MNIGELILAAALLTGSATPELADTEALEDRFPTLRMALVTLALEWEILDPRETRYVLARPEDTPGDLQMLQRRFQDLADAPPLVESFRLPDRSLVNELLVFNRAYRSYLEIRQPMEIVDWSSLREVQREIDHLYQVWDCVRDAPCDYYYITVRRHAMKRLRELIGEDAYQNLELPPHVPVWRFQAMR